MFSVDTRLVPNGKGGALVQSESTYSDYFARTADAWEGVAYMKTRAVAGNLERATEFLAALQNIDWRRYGQSGRSRLQLRHMRMRIEKELGEGNPLKTAAGGYYDIDFALMYLRLRGAGMFFKVLNTPARIQVLEQMGHLEGERRPLPARCGDVLPRRRSWPASDLRPHRRQPAQLRVATGDAHQPGEALGAAAFV